MWFYQTLILLNIVLIKGPNIKRDNMPLLHWQGQGHSRHSKNDFEMRAVKTDVKGKINISWLHFINNVAAPNNTVNCVKPNKTGLMSEALLQTVTWAQTLWHFSIPICWYMWEPAQCWEHHSSSTQWTEKKTAQTPLETAVISNTDIRPGNSYTYDM